MDRQRHLQQREQSAQFVPQKHAVQSELRQSAASLRFSHTFLCEKVAELLRRWRREEQRTSEETVTIGEREGEQNFGERARIGLFALCNKAECFAEVDELCVEETNDAEDLNNAVIRELFELCVEEMSEEKRCSLRIESGENRNVFEVENSGQKMVEEEIKGTNDRLHTLHVGDIAELRRTLRNHKEESTVHVALAKQTKHRNKFMSIH